MIKIPTSEGDKTPSQIINSLMWGSYKANMGYGCTHEQLLSIGIGNDLMKEKYEKEIANTRGQASGVGSSER